MIYLFKASIPGLLIDIWDKELDQQCVRIIHLLNYQTPFPRLLDKIRQQGVRKHREGSVDSWLITGTLIGMWTKSFDTAGGKRWYRIRYRMMTSSNGNIFRVTGHLCGEFTGPGEFSTQRPVTRSFDVYFDLCPNKRLSKQSWGWWFETPSCPLWRHRNDNWIV